MTSIATVLLLLASADGSPASPPGTAPTTLECRVEVGGKESRCRIDVPEGTRVASCAAGEKKHCHHQGDQNRRAWVSESGGLKCKISRKHTDWTRTITLRRRDGGLASRGSCTLHVVVE